MPAAAGQVMEPPVPQPVQETTVIFPLPSLETLGSVASEFSEGVPERSLYAPLVATRLRGTGEHPWDEFGTTTGRPRRLSKA